MSQKNVKMIKGVCTVMCYGERDLESKSWTMGIISVICHPNHFYHSEDLQE